MGRHAASNDSTVSPPRLNQRALRDLHNTPPSSWLDAGDLDAASFDASTDFDTAAFDADADAAAPINAADLIARFRASGLLSDVPRRAMRPVVTGEMNAPAPLSQRRTPVLNKAVALKPAAAKLESANRPADPANALPALDPSGPVRAAELLNRHPDVTPRSPLTGHRAATPRSTRTGSRALSVLRPSPSIRISVRPVLTVAAIVTAFALVEAPNLLTNSHTSAEPRASRSHTTTFTGSAAADTTSSGATIDAATTAADLPRHGLTVATGTSLGRVSRSTRRAIGDAAHHVPLMKPGQTVPGTWIRPSGGRYTSCFCSRWGSFHAGIDLAGKLGTPIFAVGDGTVLKAGSASGFGNWVVIQHSNGDVSIYGHMRYFFVHAGQKVKAGEKIAVVGDQGFSTGPHLHFEVHKGGLGGTKIDPIPWLKARGIVIGPLSKVG